MILTSNIIWGYNRSWKHIVLFAARRLYSSQNGLWLVLFHSALSCSPVSYTRLMNLTVMLQWIISSFSPVTLNWQLSSSGFQSIILNRSWFGSKIDSRNFNSAFSPDTDIFHSSHQQLVRGGKGRAGYCERAADPGGEREREGERERKRKRARERERQREKEI